MEEVKEQVLENETENIDNVLTSVNDEYLRKKKRTRKITYSILLGAVFIITLVAIILASIRVDLKPSFIGNPTDYTVYLAGDHHTIDEANEEVYEDFYKHYTQSFKISYLSALFTGKLGEYKIEETLNRFYSSDSTRAGMHRDLSNALGDNYIKLSFADEQQMKTANGKVYHSMYNSEYDLKFYDVYFNLNAENKDYNLTFYFGTTGVGSGYTITKITVRANTYALYDYLSSLN